MKYMELLSAVIITASMMSGVRSGTEVTKEQLRDGLVSLIHSYSLLDNKLDRHEQRERALGDVIKRGLQTLQKGQKIFEPLRGTFSRLDERINEIETELIAQDKRNAERQEKLGQTLDAILKWMETTTEMAKASIVVTPVQAKDSSEEMAIDSGRLTKKIDDLTENVVNLQKQMIELKVDRDGLENVQKSLVNQIDKMIALKQESADEVITKMEEKLTHFYVTSPVSTPAAPIRNTEWEDNVTGLLAEIKINSIPQLKIDSPTSSNSFMDIDREFFVTLANETLDAIEEMRLEVLTASDKSFTKTATRIKEVSDTLETSLGEILKMVADSESTFDTIIQSDKNLQTDIAGLGKLEKIVLDTADNVQSIKRGLEFNVHAVTLEVSEMIKGNAKDINSTFHNRFNNLDETIVNNHNGALLNLTSKIETEISQVWRQIGIMYQEVSASKQALNKLHEQTEAYVNGTFTTMDSMEGKVSQITGRMAEVDDNLNYLLGRLSLVTHEFNEIKTGLGTALDNIRGSFQIVQNKIGDGGPGPHKINDDELI